MSAASAMSAIVVWSKPRSSNRRSAALDDRLSRALLLALPQADVGHRGSVYLVTMQQAQLCISCNFAVSVPSCRTWHYLLGNLAAAAASHWKRSLAIVVALLVGARSARERRRRRRSQTTSRRPAPIPAGAWTCSSSASRRSRATPPPSSSRSQDGTLRDGARPHAIAGALDEIRQPAARHRRRRSAEEPGAGLARRPHRVRDGAVRPARDGPRQGAGRAPGRRDRDRGARRHRGLPPRPGGRSGRAADRRRSAS